jgi:hypothetical protein
MIDVRRRILDLPAVETTGFKMIDVFIRNLYFFENTEGVKTISVVSLVV